MVMRMLAHIFIKPAAAILCFARDRASSAAITIAGVLFVLSALFSVSLDVGNLYATKRELQAVADAAVLKAVTDPANAEALVSSVLDANGVSDELSEAPVVQLGRFPPTGYTMDTVGGLPIESRFEATSTNANALRVTVSETPALYLVSMFFDTTVRVSAQATATNRPLVQLTVRSDALGFDSSKATLYNSFLSSLLGTSVSLTAVGYNGLADANFQLFGFLDAMAVQGGTTAGDYDAVLDEDFTFPQITAGLISAITGDADFSGDVAAITAALTQIAGDLGAVGPISLGDFISYDADNPQKSAGARVNLLDFLVGSSEAANAEHGLTSEVSIPIGTGGISLTAAVVEPRQVTAIGGVGITAETAQVRMYLVIEPTQQLSVLGFNFDVRLPLLIETTKGVATVTDISCPTPLPADATVSVTATPGNLQTSIVDIDPTQLGGETAPVTQAAEIVNAAGLLTVSGTGQVDYTGSPTDLTFTAPFDENNFQTVSTTTAFGTAATSLLGTVTFDVDVLGIPLLTDTMVTNALDPILDAVAPEVDAVLNEAFDALGVRAGNMDVGIPYLRCSNPILIL